MYEIAILNPRPKKRRRKASRSKVMAKRRKKLTAKQIAAGFGGKRAKSSKRKRKHVRRAKVRKVKRVVRRRSRGGKRHSVSGYTVGTKRIRRRKLNPRSYRRRRHRNPISVSGITNQLMPAAYGAAGGIALDVALGYIPLPAMFKTGYAKHATRIAGALGIGMLAKKFLKGKGSAVAAGAMTIAVYGLLKDVIVQFAPSVRGLGDYEEISIDNTADQIGAYLPGSPVGAYLPDGSTAPGMGAYLAGEETDFDVSDTAGSNLGGIDY